MLIARAGDPEPGIAMVRGIAARASPSRRAANCPYADRVSMLRVGRLWPARLVDPRRAVCQ